VRDLVCAMTSNMLDYDIEGKREQACLRHFGNSLLATLPFFRSTFPYDVL
jgi:hypothetical protein